MGLVIVSTEVWMSVLVFMLLRESWLCLFVVVNAVWCLNGNRSLIFIICMYLFWLEVVMCC